MKIEYEIFKGCKIDLNKLINYGFNKIDNKYIYEKNFINNQFKAIITYDKDIKGKIIDNDTNEEYTNIRREITGSFVNEVKDKYIEILTDIRNKCFYKDYFVFNQSNRITKLIINKYNNPIEFLWDSTPYAGVFRNDKKKWYGIIMNIDKSKLDSNTKGKVEIINIKTNRVEELLNKKGFYPAYHMNKKYWITIILDESLSDKEIMELISESYELVL